MKSIFLMGCAMSMSAMDIVEVYGFGLSYHTDRTIDYNERNWGAGLGYAHEIENQVYVTVIGGTYRDSYNRQAKFLMPGARWEWGSSWKAAFGFNGGYFEGSGFNGVGGLPYAYVGYKRFAVCFTAMFGSNTVNVRDENDSRDPNDNHGAYTSVVGVFLKYNLVQW